MWVFGRRKESADGAGAVGTRQSAAGPAVTARFRQPTDVAWDSQGNIYITDGYVNSRVAKYDRNGDWVKSWGEPGTGPGQFRTPHAIAIDNAATTSTSAIAANQRIQVFDTDGKFLRMFTIDDPARLQAPGRSTAPRRPAGRMDGVGAPNSLCITPGAEPGDVRRREHLARADLQGDARRQGARGDRASRAASSKQFSGAHQLACPSENEIYVAESSNWRVQKLMLQSTPARPAAGSNGRGGRAP